METIYKGQKLRNYTNSEYVIFFEGKELNTIFNRLIVRNHGIKMYICIVNKT